MEEDEKEGVCADDDDEGQEGMKRIRGIDRERRHTAVMEQSSHLMVNQVAIKAKVGI